MKKYFIILLLSIFVLLPLKARALQNKGIFADYTVSDMGTFYSLNGSSVTNQWYTTLETSEFIYALPSNPNFVYGNNGASLVQCGTSFLSGNTYAVTYAFNFPVESGYYFHPFYTNVSNKIGIGSTIQNSTLSFNYSSISDGVETQTYDFLTSPFGKRVGVFTVVFKAPKSGTCINIAFSSSNKTVTGSEVGFLGHIVRDMGPGQLTESEIKSALSAEFNSLKSSIDSMKDKQDQTNEKLDKIDDTLNGEDSDITNKKCGVVCKLKGIFTGIVELPGKLISGLIDGIKGLFVPTDDQLYEIVNDSKDLTENFGFIGESMNFFINIFTTLLGLVNANGCLELPEFTIGSTTLFDSHTFWDARNVCLADNEVLSSNIDTIRSFTSIVLVAMFVSFAASKFSSILSKQSSENIYQNDAIDATSKTKWI